MPKISAATVAEHRATQRASLLRAGEAVLRDGGLEAFTPRAVCEQAGLARSSFYDYFATKDDLLIAIAIAEIEGWDAEIESTLTGVEPGLPELRAFVESTMAMTADGRHDLAGVLREARLKPSHFEDLETLHDALLRPVRRVLDDLGIENPGNLVMLVQGVLGAGVQLVSHGVEHDVVAADTYDLLVTGLVATR